MDVAQDRKEENSCSPNLSNSLNDSKAAEEAEWIWDNEKGWILENLVQEVIAENFEGDCNSQTINQTFSENEGTNIEWVLEESEGWLPGVDSKQVMENENRSSL